MQLRCRYALCLRFLGVALWRGLMGCACVSVEMRCDDVPAFLRGCAVAWADGLCLRFCGDAL